MTKIVNVPMISAGADLGFQKGGVVEGTQRNFCADVYSGVSTNLNVYVSSGVGFKNF